MKTADAFAISSRFAVERLWQLRPRIGFRPQPVGLIEVAKKVYKFPRIATGSPLKYPSRLGQHYREPQRNGRSLPAQSCTDIHKTILRPSIWMVAGWRTPDKNLRLPLSGKTPESEKITINMGFVDLGHVDLLVAEGFYSNRTDFIRTAIRTHLASHADVLRQAVSRKSRT